ncbi:MAG TPA: precorrin-3B C(17)-methyltransferase, partial [Porphyromonadaceae bacterium]|nr:precorrin-3B C(17)-methyltransferase [Porphyromonadaceae bacterium]
DTPVGHVRQAGRPEQEIRVTTLGAFDPEEADMFSLIIIGNSQTYFSTEKKIITPRGYYRDEVSQGGKNLGQDIMIRSFRTIEKELRHPDIPLDKKWALLHAIHTTADFEMERIFHADEHAVEKLYGLFASGQIKTVVTDVTMVASGIRKGALERMGVEAVCCLHDPRV